MSYDLDRWGVFRYIEMHIGGKENGMANDISTYEGFIAEAKTAMEENFEDTFWVVIDEVDGYKRAMIDALEDIFNKGESTRNVKCYSDEDGGPAFDYAESLGYSTSIENTEIKKIDWVVLEDDEPIEMGRLTAAYGISKVPEWCLRAWFDEKFDRDIVNDEWILN